MESAGGGVEGPTGGKAASAAASGGDKGLKSGAIGFASTVVIGVASTAPGYSLAASLGVVAATGVGLFFLARGG